MTDEQLDTMGVAFHQASALHAEHLALYGDEVGDLVTIDEYDEAFCAMGLGFLGAHRRMLMAQTRVDSDGIDLVAQEQVLPDDPTCCSRV